MEGLILTPHIASHAADNFEKTVRHMFGFLLLGLSLVYGTAEVISLARSA